MNDRVGNIELAALAAATDANGRVDPIRLEAQRLILSRQQIDGIDAGAIVRDVTASPAFAQGGPESAKPLLDAIRTSLSPIERVRLNEAIDRANVWDGSLERAGEVLGGTLLGAYTGARDGISALDQRATGALGSWRQWADGERTSTENSFLQRAAGSGERYRERARELRATAGRSHGRGQHAGRDCGSRGVRCAFRHRSGFPQPDDRRGGGVCQRRARRSA